MKFKRDFLQKQVGRAEEETLTGWDRYSVFFEMVFEHEGKFYFAEYEQDTEGGSCHFEGEEGEIECPEVHSVLRMKPVWELV